MSVQKILLFEKHIKITVNKTIETSQIDVI